MPLYTVCGFEYGEGFGPLFERRLAEYGLEKSTVSSSGAVVTADIEADRLGALASAAARLILEDLRYTELKRLASLLPLSVRERKSLLPLAMELSGETDRFEEVRAELITCLAENDLLVVEGALRFRLQGVLEAWAIAVDRAGEELLLRQEYCALMQLLSVVADAEGSPGFPRRVRVILYPDGSSAVTDQRAFRIESSSSEGACLIGLLLGLSPEYIEVYDLTDGRSRSLLESIRIVFGGKARIFIKQSKS